MRTIWHIPVVLLLAAGCGSHRARVAVQGTPDQIAALAGSWSGTYEGSGHRSGLIDFSLTGAGREAEGDVLMMADRRSMPYRPYAPPNSLAGVAGERERSQVLTIRFVHAEAGGVSGTLDPYWDPERGCEVLATFTGTVHEGTVTGRFQSTCRGGMLARRGTWKVTRRRRREDG